MNDANDFQNNSDLAFFGKVNASISHELKNILAIISETAGLLNDLTEMITRGEKVDLKMLMTCSRDIEEEIQRGFGTIKQMNTFSHSVDDPLKSVNLIEALDLVINLAAFLSFAGKVRFDPPQDEAPMVLTCPFRLQNLVYHTLVFAFKSVGADGEIQVAVHRETNGSARIAFSGLGTKGDLPFPSEETKNIAKSIGAEIRMADDFQTIDILVPQFVESPG
ncbi:MAG: HAMP domain-containing histidine kinase [Deltaproteobacteria bacterium]|nr:HAMP domain-containing histidine kinase [Deltaproteobacteria bacterium]